MRRDDTIYLAKYAHDNYLIKNTGWKLLHRFMKNNKKMNRLFKAAKAKHQNNTLRIKFVMDIPCDHKEVIIFDADNGNTNWKDTEIL